MLVQRTIKLNLDFRKLFDKYFTFLIANILNNNKHDHADINHTNIKNTQGTKLTENTSF